VNWRRNSRRRRIDHNQFGGSGYPSRTAKNGQEHGCGQGKDADKSIDTSTIVGLRDRALIAVMVYGFARVGAVIAMNVEDYYPQGKRWWFRLHEKGGKNHELPAHHKAEEYMDAYLEATKLWDAKKWPLFRTAAGRTGALTATRMNRIVTYRLIQRRRMDAGIDTKIGCRSFRATGITNYLQNGGKLDVDQPYCLHR
jgi:integrase